MTASDQTVMLHLNQMTVTNTQVHSPVGTFDVVGTRWRWESTWGIDQQQPAWALIAGILTFWTVIGIAFFFVSRSVYWARVTVTMTAATGAWWSETVSCTTPEDRSRLEQYLMHLDNWSLTAATALPNAGETSPRWEQPR